jgi:uncharacterized membrane protein
MKKKKVIVRHELSQQETEKHPKQDFQVERLTFFSDAVFAIAITLLIIEFKVPHVTKESSFNTVWTELVDLRNSLFALLLSFTLIASFWIQHHFLFKHLHNYNNRIVVASFFVLLPIIFFPFTTAFLAESSENSSVVILAFRLFLVNNILAGMALYFFYWLALKKYKELSYEMNKTEKIKFNSAILFKTGIFLVILLLTLFTANIKILFWAIVICLILRKMFDRYIKSKIAK